MIGINHKILIDPKFTDYMNRLPKDESDDLNVTLTQVVDNIDKSLSKYEPKDMLKDMNEPQVALKIMPPVERPTKNISANGIRSFVKKVSKAMPGFAGSHDCKALNTIADTSENPVGRKITNYKMFKVLLSVYICFVDIPKGNKITEMIGSMGVVAHCTIGFNTNDGYTGEFPVDLPMVKQNAK